MRYLLSIIILVLFSTSVFAAGPALNYSQFKFQGVYAKDVPGAATVEQVYRSVLPAGPATGKQLVTAPKRLGVYAKNRLATVRKQLDPTLDGDPYANARGFFVRGTLFLLRGEYPEALADFYSSMEFDPSNKYAAQGAYIALNQMWSVLSAEQKNSWGSQIGGKITEMIAGTGLTESGEYILAAEIFRKIDDPVKSLVIVEKGLEFTPDNKSLLSLRTSIIAK